MPELLDDLNAALEGRYTLERLLGEGGMATVYLAHDPRHNRNVAVKVLRPELAAALGPERFLREIEIAAGLTHPHIVPVFDSGQAGEHLYYVMPYVEGESLRDRLKRERQLPIDEALQLTREVADALGAAHSRGFVHRDIKPENILLQGGHAMVTDFGIARALTSAGGGRLTETGIAIGTPAYMSPEQAVGDRDVDGRSDVYSLACVTYEMLIGHPPFSGVSAVEVLARHTADPVPPLRTVRETIPEPIERAIARALAKVPADRYATSGEFAAALSGVAEPVRAGSRRGARRRWLIGGLGAIAVVALAAAAVLRLARHGPGVPQMPTVVVLPFQPLEASGDPWFAQGITEEVSSRLTQVSGLRVIAPRSAAQFAVSGRSLREFGHEVGAQYALEANIAYDQGVTGPRRVRVSPQLIRVSDGQLIWGDRYTDTLTSGQIFDVQADIAEHVAQALDVELLAGERRDVQVRPTDNPDAYDAYLRGNQDAHGGYIKDYVPSSRRAAIEEYTRAVTLDTGFAEAHARLAFQQSVAATADSDLVPARQHAERALALRPDLAWTHLALATCAFYGGEWDRFRSEAALAEELGQNSAEVLEATATLYWWGNLFEGMQRNYERAAVLDPLSWETALDLGIAYFGLRRHADAERSLDRAIALDSTRQDPYVYKAWLYLAWHGDVAAASRVLQTAVRRLGSERGFATGFLNSHWWASRLLARDPWYRGMLAQASVGAPNLDSVAYYEHKAALYEGLSQAARARAYWDSVAAVAGRRLAHHLLWRAEAVARADLAWAYAGMGDRGKALDQAHQYAELEHRDNRRPITLALIHAALGDADEAAAQFERTLDVPDFVTLTFLSLDPTFQRLRSNPRFRHLLDTK